MKRTIIASTVLAATASVVLAHSGATGVVKERMDQMGMIGKSMKAIGGMVKGQEDYDAATVRSEAGMIASHGGETLTKLFPEGSTKHPSEARPAIWSDWKRFQQLADDLTLYANALAAGAENDRGNQSASTGSPSDLTTMSPDDLFAKVAGTCLACHKDFRVKK